MNDSILIAREKRFEYITELSKTYPSIIVLKANTPGPDKNRYSSFFLIDQFNRIIESKFQFDFKTLKKGFDGPYYVYAFSTILSKDTKLELIDIENTNMLGRLIDIDLYINAKMISRSNFEIDLRGCMICNHSAIDCMRNKRHSVEEILNHIDARILYYLNLSIGPIIKSAMYDELNLDDKFGLVTPTSSGSHTDMDYAIMIKSIDILNPYFLDMFELGFKFEDEKILFQKARIIGINAERDMLNNSNGINTYKGLIYILGFVLLALGYIVKHNKPFDSIFSRIKDLSKDVLNDFKNDINSAGVNAYKNYQIKGIRGEVHDGLPTVQNALNYFEKLDSSNPINFHHILLYFIMHSQDTILLKRSKTLDRYLQIKAMSKQVDPYNEKDIKDFTAYCIKNHISFGGSADLFIVFQFLNKIKLFLK
ncbi:triphosphoribosyl-dephospho-CoA synthase [Mariniplasma anaerobium]|nr:triphosphoribosyl-dephospho-CoA synthase [Mariniplasma anaerobium]